MSTEGDAEIDSDLEDPDLEDLESLRKALGTDYTAGGHDVDSEGDSDEEAELDAQQQCQRDTGQREQQCEGLDPPDAKADLPGSHQGLPIGSPGAFQQQIALQNGTQAHAASGEAANGDERDSAADEDEEDDEEWEPAPTRTELLRDAVQYLHQASAEEGTLQDADDEEEDEEETAVSRLERALAANRRLQERLVGILEAIDGALWSNAQMQAKLMHNSWLHPRAGRYRGMRVVTNAAWGETDASAVGPSQFWVAGRQVPEPNADTLQVAPVFQYLPQQFKDPSWLPEETACLTDALLKAAQRARRAKTAAKLASGSREPQSPPLIDKDDPENQTELTLQSRGVEGVIDGFDSAAWEEIARIGPASRSTEECWKQWTHQLRPSLNRADWTADEDASLLAQVNRLGTHAWDEVAEGLGTGRTPAACLAQYQRRQKRDALLNSKWTPEEATRLAQVIAKLGTRDWQAVAVEMGGRTPGQVQHFYQDNLSNCYKKGAWDPEEDEALRQAVKACGKHWRDVAKRVPARTDKQCRERYANVLDPDLRLYAEWTPEEDALLLCAIEAHTQPDGKIRWAAVSRMIPGRTDHVCQRHYKILTKEGPPRQKHARPVRQRSGRFVAWEKVNPSELTAPSEAETLAIEGAPASAAGAHQAPSAAPAGTGRKAQGARKAKRKAKRTKRKARASSPEEEEELVLAGIDGDVRPSDSEGGAVGARQSRLVGAEGTECGQKEPASAAEQPPSRRGRSRKNAEGSQRDDEAAGVGDTTASAISISPSRRQRNLSRGSQTRRPKAHGSAATTVQEGAVVQSTGPKHKKGAMPVVKSRGSTRKRKAG